MLIVAESQDGLSRLTGLNIHSGQRTFIAALEPGEMVLSLDCSRAFAYPITAGNQFELKRICLKTGQIQTLTEPVGLEGQITDMALSPSGQSLAVCLIDEDERSALYVFDVEADDQVFRLAMRIGNRAAESQRFHAPLFLGSDTRLLVQLEASGENSQMGILISGRVGAPDSIAPGANKAGRLELIELPYQIDVGHRPVTDSSGTQVWLIGSSGSVSPGLLRLDVPSRTAAPIHGAPGGAVICSRNGTENSLLFGNEAGLYQVTEHTANLVCELDSEMRLIDIISDEPADSWIYLVQTPRGMEYRNIDILSGTHSILLRFQSNAAITPLGFISDQLLTSSNYSRLEALPIVDEVGTAISLDATENRGGQSSLNAGEYSGPSDGSDVSIDRDDLFSPSSDQTDTQDGFESVFTHNRTTAERLNQARTALVGPPNEAVVPKPKRGLIQSLKSRAEATMDDPYDGDHDNGQALEVHNASTQSFNMSTDASRTNLTQGVNHPTMSCGEAAGRSVADGSSDEHVSKNEIRRAAFLDGVETVVDKAGAARFPQCPTDSEQHSLEPEKRTDNISNDSKGNETDHGRLLNDRLSHEPVRERKTGRLSADERHELTRQKSEWTTGMAEKEDDVWTSAPAAIKPEEMVLGRAERLFPKPTHRELMGPQPLTDANNLTKTTHARPDVDFELWLDSIASSPNSLDALAELNPFVKDAVVGSLATEYFHQKIHIFESGKQDGNALILAISAIGLLKSSAARGPLLELCEQAYRRIKSSGGLPEAHEHFAMAAVRALSSKRGRFSAPAVFNEYDSVISQTEKILAHEGEKRARRFIGAVSKKYRFALAKLIGKPDSEAPKDQRASRPDGDEAELDRLSRIEELMEKYEFPDSLINDESIDEVSEPDHAEPFRPLTNIPSVSQVNSVEAAPLSSRASMDQFSVDSDEDGGPGPELGEGFRARLSVPASGNVRRILNLGGIVAFVAGLALAILGFRLGLAPSIAGLILCFGGVGLLSGRRKGWLLGLFGYLTTGFVLISFPFLKPLPPDVLPAGLQVMGGGSIFIAILLCHGKIRVHLGRMGIDGDTPWDE
ncbi:MAG: hypothetical protein VYA30_11725 [Myxococcota bacterium]|nr:hypothetical protein [Myxococcota bacterium]